MLRKSIVFPLILIVVFHFHFLTLYHCSDIESVVTSAGFTNVPHGAALAFVSFYWYDRNYPVDGFLYFYYNCRKEKRQPKCRYMD